MFKESFKGILRKFQRYFKEGRLNGVSREFHLFQGYLKEVKGNSRDVSKVFQVCFRELLRVFQVSF